MYIEVAVITIAFVVCVFLMDELVSKTIDYYYLFYKTTWPVRSFLQNRIENVIIPT